MKESYEKRLNILVHGQREAESPWEKKEDSLALFRDFMRDGLKIDDPCKPCFYVNNLLLIIDWRLVFDLHPGP